MVKKSRQLFAKWNAESLSYLHWKGNDHLMEALDGETDLDVLLSKEDKDKGCSLLKEIGFVKFKSQFGSRYYDVEDWIGFDDETGKLLHLHLHYSLVSGHQGLKEYNLPWTQEAIQTRIFDTETGIYIMDPNLEIVSLYTRLVTKAKRDWIKNAKRGKYKLDKHFSKEIAYIKRRVNWEIVKGIFTRYYGDNSSELLEIAQTENMSARQYLRLYEIVRQTLSYSLRYNAFKIYILRAFYFFAMPIRNMVCRHGGIVIIHKVLNPKDSFSVALIGQDGCGKSTVTLEMEKWLNWKIDARRFYLGSGDHYNGFLKRLLRKATNAKHTTGKQNSIKDVLEKDLSISKRKKTIKSFVASLLVAVNHLNVAHRAYIVIMKSEKYRQKGGIPLFDRFPQNQFCGIYDGPKIDEYIKRTGLDFSLVKFMAKMERYYIEKIQRYQPNLVFKLMLSPEESLRRKPFENYKDVSHKHEITKKLQFPSSDVIVVDATQDYSQEIIFIKGKIWKTILKYAEKDI